MRTFAAQTASKTTMTIQQFIRFAFLCAGISFSLSLQAQSFIRGTIFDKKYNEPLTGATILIEGTSNGTTADIDGNYELKVTPGTYNLIVSYVSYTQQKINNIAVTNTTPTILNIEMEEASLELESVQVVAQIKTDTDLSLLRNVRAALQVVSGISAQEISRTLDSNASEVVKRVPGVTIQDNRFIVVRGLNQRYNNVWLNNASAPSSETDIKAFSFDAIPGNMIDNLLIFKTGSAENPAEATGGFIKISTKNIPDAPFVNAEYGIAYNDISTFQPNRLLPSYAIDLAGLGHIPRGLPSEFPPNLNRLPVAQRDAAALKLSPYWEAIPGITLPNQKAGVSIGNRWNLSNGARIGNISSISWSSSHSTIENSVNNMYERYDFDLKTPIYWSRYSNNTYSSDYRVGILHNWAYQDTHGNKLEFKNLLNQIGSQKTATNTGWNNNRLSNFEYYSNQYSARTTYSGQISGNHQPKAIAEHTFDWNIGFSYANRIEPDRQNWSKKEVTPGIYQFVLPDVPSINELGRLYLTNNEYVTIAAFNWEKKTSIGGHSTTLKAGTYNEYKSRDFQERSITYRNAYGSLTAEQINELPFENLFNDDYLGNGKIISADEQTNIANQYKAQNHLSAAYAAMVISAGPFQINGGMRAEFNRLTLQGYYNASSPVNVDAPKLNFFPSVNTAFNIDTQNTLRLAYSRSMNRPEFREVAPLTYYDFTEKNSVIGNPQLKDASIHNIDLRYEHYPSPRETVSIAAFYKKFTNPIEMVSIGAASMYSFNNALAASNYGIEIDIKKNLAFISLSDFNVNLNASFIHSEVKFVDLESERNRTLQGQSPYVINTGIFYQNDANGISSTLMYNVMGKRILVAAQLNQGRVEVPDIYEMPRHAIDFSINKKLGKQLEIKIGIKDLLAQDHRTQQTFETERNGVLEKATLVNKLYNTGRTYSLGIALKL